MKIILLIVSILIVCALCQKEYRTFDGTNNNKNNPLWGSINVPLERKLPLAYDDKFSTPTGGFPSRLLSARLVSNAIAGRKPEYEIQAQLSNTILVTFWGQIIDHDLTFSLDTSDTGICNRFDIPIPKGDLFYDSDGTGNKTMMFCRLEIIKGTGTNVTNPLKFPNILTSYLDASMVYGETNERAKALRTFQNGLMNTSKGIDGDFLPVNNNGRGGTIIPMANAARKFPDNQLFMAGDLRANENPILLSLHTILVREHNRIAKSLPSSMNDEEKYQQARKMVIAFVQAITIEQFLPAVLGTKLPAYKGYNPSVNPNIDEFFSTVAYRFGHDQLPDVLHRFDTKGKSISQGAALLRDVFFDIPSFTSVGASVYMRGAAVSPQRVVDSVIEDDVRIFLYGRGPATAFDLVARNMQRARDIGIGFYNDARKAYGLPVCDTFACVNDDPEIVSILNNLYGNNNVSFLDCFVGGLLEKKANPNSKLGALFSNALIDQFSKVRDGDRFWYESPGVLTSSELKEVRATTLADIIKRNTDSEIFPTDVFNRRNVAPEKIYNPTDETKWVIAIIVLTVVAGICIILVIGLCFARKNDAKRVNGDHLYTNLNSDNN